MEERIINTEVRKSEYKMATLANDKSYEFPVFNENRDGKWRIIRYVNGHFDLHEDQQKKANHVGTEIMIFPKS